MKTYCNIIRDLLPLYHDGVCSQESTELVQGHLQACPQCRQELQMLETEDVDLPAKPEEKNLAQAASNAWKRGRRKACIAGIAMALVGVLFVSVLQFFAFTKGGQIAIVHIWEESLTEYAQEKLEQGEKYMETRKGLRKYDIRTIPEAGCVFITTGFFGYYGFYYSEDGNPVGHYGADMPFVKTEDGWLWEEVEGDNWMYTEHITGNWYWYEAHY